LKNIVDNYSKSSSIIENPIYKIKPEMVSLATLLDQYKNNEVRADGLYKDKIIQTTGIVEMVKKDIINDTYVILRTERGLEIPMVQCYFDKQFISQVSQLNPGDNITIKGHLKGLMLNVLFDKCSLVQTKIDDDSKNEKNSLRGKKINSPLGEALSNGNYSLDGSTVIKLENGIFEKGTIKNFDYMRIDFEGFSLGDINGDGEEDAAVILSENGGGSGFFYSLITLISNKDNFLQEGTPVSLGDRILLNSINIKKGIIIIDMITHGPQDASCCPTVRVIAKYQLIGDKLTRLK